MNYLHVLNKFLSNNKEFLVVGIILLVLSMLIVPLAPEVIDVLIAINFSITILVLMIVIYIKSPTELSAFPSILLVLALFRIGISISTSRLVLLHANAGEIIYTFGSFVAGGNLIVGLIIFIIITIVNFIVITKGSERVAEVGARFTLDAMPGKQMSIDADLKANNITMEEAINKRKLLEMESKLYGAMDGSMKFVKGDAIAGILIVVVNMIGGISVGILQKSMDMQMALTTYTILSVGDGMVQQIPSLIVSITAGLMITQVGYDDYPGLGKNLVNQLFQNYKSIFAASILVVLLAAIPGMPKFTLAIIFIAVIFIGFFTKRTVVLGAKNNNNIIEEEFKDTNTTEDKPVELLRLTNWEVAPFLLYLAANLKNSEELAQLKNALILVQNDLISSLGVEIPQIILRYNESIEYNSYQIAVYEIPISSGVIYLDKILIIDKENEFAQYFPDTNTIPNVIDINIKEKSFWVDKDIMHDVEGLQFNIMTINDVLLTHLSIMIRRNISDFLGMQEVKNMLDKAAAYQDLIRELLRMLPLNKVTEILQRLVFENISIRNFKVILDAMLEWSQREKDIVLLTEYVRQALGKYIGYKFSNGSYIIPAVLLDPSIEDIVRDSVRFSDSGAYVSMAPELVENIVLALDKIYVSNATLIPMVIATQMDIRRYVRSIIEKRIPALHVLSFQEVQDVAEFEVIAVASLATEPN